MKHVPSKEQKLQERIEELEKTLEMEKRSREWERCYYILNMFLENYDQMKEDLISFISARTHPELVNEIISEIETETSDDKKVWNLLSEIGPYRNDL